MDPLVRRAADGFVNSLGLATDESSTDIVQSIVVLLSSPSQAIIEAAMKVVGNLIMNCSAKIHLDLVQADLIPQLINTLNAVSLSFEEAADIHIHLMSSIATSVRLASPDGLIEFRIKYGNEQQAVHGAVLQQVLVPS
ncbi:hypothetical protein BLNAU_10712 [Blattamonas nauphoetae]|uniref:Uncharacterized protein n=1 Tax=Blattamonas nauphoetae TaxID=2049346 RepID=A0ABQ9XRP1_9EUKA|nr:hypothetical protein BLNAU_10712 [Blattamonas nauphoetae]